MLTRRQVLKGATFVAAGAAFPAQFAWAQVVSADISRFSPTQRILLNGILYTDPVAYLAFCKIVGQNMRGAAAQIAFDQELTTISAQTLAIKAQQLDSALSHKIVVDCTVSAAGTLNHVPFSSLLGPAVPRLGVSGIISYQTGLAIPAEVRSTVADVQTLLSQATSLKFLTVAPGDTASNFISDGLEFVSSGSGLQAILAQSTAVLGQTGLDSGRIQTIAAALSQVATSTKGFVESFSAITAPGQGAAADPNQLANDAEAAMTALGHLTGMNPATVQKVNTALKVAGSALSGAVAGAAVGGPVGAAIGGALGLLGGLFSGGGEDPTVQMISQLDTKLSYLQLDMEARFNALASAIGTVSNQIVTLDQDMRSAFSGISSQLQRMQQNIEENIADVRQLIINVTQQQIQNTINAFNDTGRVYEQHYRLAALGGSNATAVQIQWQLAASAFVDTVTMSGSGFSQLAFVGDDYLTFRQELLNNIQNNQDLRIGDNFTGAPIHVGNPFPLPGAQPTGPRDIESAIEQTMQRLQDPRYSAAADQSQNLKASPNGAAIINFLHQRYIGVLQNLSSSQEWALMDADQRELVSDPSQPAPPPIAPQDLLTIAINSQKCTASGSDIPTARSIMEDCYNALKPHIAAHSLLSAQYAIPILCYVRRQLIQRIANRSAAVFCNTFMLRVDVLRRGLSTAASAGSNPGHRNSPTHFQVHSKVEALAMIQQGRSLLPLSGVATTVMPDAPNSDRVEQSIDRFFANLPAAEPPPFGYIANTARTECAFLARYLPDSVRSITGESLSEHLEGILADGLALGVAEACLEARADTLTRCGVPVTGIVQWSQGILPYIKVAALALGQPRPSLAGFPPEYNMARAVLGSVLLGGGPVGAPTIPNGVPDEGLPYIWQVGDFWGWGIETCRPQSATQPALIRTLMRAEGAFSLANSALLAATEALAVIQATLVQYRAADDIIKIAANAANGGVRSMLRGQLGAAS